MDEERTTLEEFVASYRLCEHPSPYCSMCMRFVIQPVELAHPVRLEKFSGDTTVVAQMVALLSNCYDFDNVVVAGQAADASTNKGCSFWVAAIDREAYSYLTHLIEPSAIENTSLEVALADHLASLLDQAVVVPVSWSPAGKPCFADALRELEYREATRLVACGVEPQLTVVTDDGEMVACPLQVSAVAPFMNTGFYQQIQLEAQLPTSFEVYDCAYGVTRLVEKLSVVVSRYWLQNERRWCWQELYLSARGRGETRSAPCAWSLQLAPCIAREGESLPDLYAKMAPVPYWLIRALFESYPGGWEWENELRLWVNVDRDEEEAFRDHWERHNPQVDGPYAAAEDRFWERIEPSRW